MVLGPRLNMAAGIYRFAKYSQLAVCLIKSLETSSSPVIVVGVSTYSQDGNNTLKWIKLINYINILST
jgi:hypothetical protein